MANPHKAGAAHRGTAAVLYSASVALPTWAVKWMDARRGRAMAPRLGDDYLDGLTRTYLITAALMAVAVALSRLGLALAAVLTLYHLRAPSWPVYEAEEERPHPLADQT